MTTRTVQITTRHEDFNAIIKLFSEYSLACGCRNTVDQNKYYDCPVIVGQILQQLEYERLEYQEFPIHERDDRSTADELVDLETLIETARIDVGQFRRLVSVMVDLLPTDIELPLLEYFDMNTTEMTNAFSCLRPCVYNCLTYMAYSRHVRINSQVFFREDDININTYVGLNMLETMDDLQELLQFIIPIMTKMNILSSAKISFKEYVVSIQPHYVLK